MALADLVVSLTAETAQFRVAMERAAATSEKSFNKMLGGAKTLAAGMAAYLSADLFVGFIKGQIDAMDQLDEMSQKVGIATDELSKLAYAAKFSGVDVDGLQTALVKLSKAAIEASTGSKSANEAFSAIGVSLTDSSGKLKATEVLLGDIAEAFSQYEDGAGKVAIATSIFGKSGADLIPLLNGGRKGLKDMGNELQSLGGVVMPEAAARAAQFNDNVDRLTVTFKSFAKGIANEIIPVLNRYMEEIIAAEKAQLSFTEKLRLGISNPFKGAEEQAASLRAEIKKLEDEIPNLGMIDKFFKGKEGREDRIATLKKELAYYDELIKARTKVDKPTPVTTKGQIKPPSEGNKAAIDNEKKLAETIKNLRTEYINLFSTKEQIAAQQAKELGANQSQINIVTTLTKAIADVTAAKENQKKIDELEKQAKENVSQILKSLNDEYLNLTTTTEELALIKAVANNADYKQIELILNIIDSTKKLQEQQEDQRKSEELAIKNSEAAIRNLEAAREEHNAMLANENELYERYKDLIDSTDNSLQKFEKAQQKLLDLREQLIAAGYKQEEVDYRISEALKKQQAEMMSVDDSSKNMQQTYKVLGQTMSSAFEDAIMQAKDYKDILNGILTDIAQIVLRRTLTDPLQKTFENYMSSVGLPGFLGGSTPSPATTPMNAGVGFQIPKANANGGIVSRNNPYLVGERGAEIFVPNSNGTIIPNGRGMDGGGVAVNINNYSGQQVQTREVKDARGNRSITVQIGDVVAQEIARNGSNANMALRTTFSTKPNLVGR